MGKKKSALVDAAEAGDVTEVKRLMGKRFGPKIEDVNENEDTALNIACFKGHIDVVKELMKYRPNWDARDMKGWTPLMSAVSNGHVDLVQLLVDNKADMEAESEKGNSSLNVAAIKEQFEVLKVLIDRGANIHTEDNNGWSPLNNACHLNNMEITKYLLQKGAKLESSNERGFTPLNTASQDGHVEMVEYLLSQGAKIEAKNNSGFTPLSSACLTGKVNVVNVLIKKGANVNSTSAQGFTPVICAAQQGSLENVESLVGKGASVGNKTTFGATALHLASHNGHFQTVLYLHAKGADINTETEQNQTPLTSASEGGHLDVVQYLVKEGLDVNHVIDDTHESSLHLAAKNGRLSTVMFLTECKADLDLKDSEGRTAMQLAKEKKKKETANYLKKAPGYERDREKEREKREKKGKFSQLFLSYNWGKKAEIKLLHQRLQSHGYSCWLDIDHLGGDRLQGEMDKGVRGCKVFISCVSEAYNQSKTSQRELSLADNLQKPIIPILLEKMNWPPPAPNGVIFNQIEYIPFTRKEGMEQKSWDGQGTADLLKKIKETVKKPENKSQPLEKIQQNENQPSKTCVIQ